MNDSEAQKLKAQADEIRARCAQERVAFESWWGRATTGVDNPARAGLIGDVAWRAWYARSCQADGARLARVQQLVVDVDWFADDVPIGDPGLSADWDTTVAEARAAGIKPREVC